MPKLSQSEIAALARDAGFTGNNVAIAAAIAMAESGGNTDAYNGKDRDSSYGLWQINMKGGLGPDRRKRFGLNSNNELFDPKTNARVAYGIFKTGGFAQWTTYTRGAYKNFGPDRDAGKNISGAVSGVVDTVKDTTMAVPNAINGFGDNLIKASSNMAAVIVGAVLLLVGVLILVGGPLISTIISVKGKAKIVKKAVT